MKRLKVRGLCVVAMLAITAGAASASAFAAPPEIGRCVSHAGGKYTNNVCTQLAKSGKTGSFEWESGALKNKFTGSGGVATLETEHSVKVSCKTETSDGEYTSSKTVGSVLVVFTGCESVGFKCYSAGAAEGVIAVNPLAGMLVWEKYGKKVAIDLSPQSGEVIVEFTCGPSPVEVTGSVLTNIPANKSERDVEEKFTAKKGKQKPEYYYTSKTEKVKDVLTTRIGGPASEFVQSGQTVTNIQTDEEPLEVNTTV